jgi:hypothetical protein
MSDSPMLGPKLLPPRGGLLRLQDALSARARRSFHTRTWVAAGVAASLVALSILLVVPGALRQHRVDAAIQTALTATPETHFENGAYQVLPSNNPNVQILLVGSLPQRQAPANVNSAD